MPTRRDIPRSSMGRSAPPEPGAAPRGAAGVRPALATGALLFALALAVVAAHAPVLRCNAIALDDPLFVVQNPLVLHPSGESVRRFFSEVTHPSTVSAYYLPLSMTSLMLDVAAGGTPTHLAPFHLTSLVLHVLATLLLFLLLRRLCGCGVPAALAALLYGVHPLMVESIASAGERKTVLATALAFASVWAHVRFAQGGGRGARWASIGLFALALLAKPSVLALPLVLLVFDVWPLRRLSLRSVWEKWPQFSLAAVSAVITVLAVKETWEFGAPPPTVPVVVALKATWLLGFYARKLAWPGELSTIYAPPAPFSLANPAVLAGVAAGVVLTLAAWFARRRAPAALAGWSVFVLLLAPTFGILSWSAVFAYDRYAQLPSLGVAFALAAALTAAWRAPARARPGPRAALALVVVAVALAEAAATRATLSHWRDSVTLWQRAARLAPGVPDAHNGLGATYSDLHRSADAVAEFQRAIAVEPNYVDAHQNLGREWLRAGHPDRALPELEFAAARAPRSASAALELGLALQALGRLPAAEMEDRRALALRPGLEQALRPLATVLVLENRADEGLPLLREAAARAPEDAGALTALAAALAQSSGPSDEVVRLLEHALARNPGFTPALNELAWLRATARDAAFRDTTAALRLSALALASAPDANALDTRAAALAAAGRFAQAAATAERAVALARAAHDDTLAADAARRLAVYRSGRPFVQQPPRVR